MKEESNKITTNSLSNETNIKNDVDVNTKIIPENKRNLKKKKIKMVNKLKKETINKIKKMKKEVVNGRNLKKKKKKVKKKINNLQEIKEPEKKQKRKDKKN